MVQMPSDASTLTITAEICNEGRHACKVQYMFHTNLMRHTPTHPHTHTYTHPHPPPHIHTHTHTHTHTHRHTHTHTHAHTQTHPNIPYGLLHLLYNTNRCTACTRDRTHVHTYIQYVDKLIRVHTQHKNTHAQS